MLRFVTEDRLTRQELGWLLMQEARGTARALRNEVGQLKTGDRQSDEAPPVDSMLDALDGAIEMMSALEAPAGPALGHGKDRRGRIDIAALLFDLAPNAKISIEPGAGTEVFGVETELRRVLDLLVCQSGSDTKSSPGIEVRRDGDWVIVSVAIGPEGLSTRDLEHRWLNRMAARHGGRVEFAGNVTRLCLPADSSSGQQEILQLRKELEQAQQLGAVYARELAEAFAVSAVPVPIVADIKPPSALALKVLISTSASLLRTLRSNTDALRQDAIKIARALGESHDLVTSLNLRLMVYGEVITDLERVSRVSPEDPPHAVDLAPLLRETVDAADGRARRHDVRLFQRCNAGVRIRSRPQILSLLMRALIDQAVLSTPRDGRVEVSVSPIGGDGVAVSFIDDGPVVPEATRGALLLGEVDPATIGRPAALSWITAGACAMTLGLDVHVGETTEHRSEVRFTLPHGDQATP